MRPATADDVLELLDASFTAAAVGAALELGVFWLLEERALGEPEVAQALGVPPGRCRHWLALLCHAGLLENGPHGYQLTEQARAAILRVYSEDTWALLAQEARERLPGICGLPDRLRAPTPLTGGAGTETPAYVARMVEDPQRARQFTRMLCELHRPLAEALAEALDLHGVARLLDLGGGSGVLALALVRRHSHLAVTVVDVESVCAAGREIVAESALGDRIAFQAADFLRDPLPVGFDMVVECDVGVYGEALFAKVRNALRPGGRLVIVDQLAIPEGPPPFAHLRWAFERSLRDPGFSAPAEARLREQLEAAGFKAISEGRPLTIQDPARRMSEGMVVIEARG